MEGSKLANIRFSHLGTLKSFIALADIVLSIQLMSLAEDQLLHAMNGFLPLSVLTLQRTTVLFVCL